MTDSRLHRRPRGPTAGRTRRLAAPVAVLLAIAGLSSRTTAQRDGRAFTADERRRLAAGELVRRDITLDEDGHAMFGGTSFMRVRMPLERVWRVVRDPSIFPRLVPSLEHVEVVARRGDELVLRMHHRYALASTQYHVRMRVDGAARRISFHLDRSRPHDVRAGRGFLELRAWGDDTMVSWGMLADVGAGILQEVFGPFLNEWLLIPPRCLRDELEPGRENTC
ncbi:MAG TPA: SRPBCC family protein [Sandaracinaceae bacterium LLY-WYZ-13_1]|nr:SRPBCC family protein [Sandaracinaceae bacterium LLY-WYZ-13_1]